MTKPPNIKYNQGLDSPITNSYKSSFSDKSIKKSLGLNKKDQNKLEKFSKIDMVPQEFENENQAILHL